MGETPIFNNTVPLPKGNQKQPRVVPPISATLSRTEMKVYSGDRKQIPRSLENLNWFLIQVTWRKGSCLDEKTHPPFLDNKPKFGFYCDVRKRNSSTSNDIDVPMPTKNCSHGCSTEFRGSQDL